MFHLKNKYIKNNTQFTACCFCLLKQILLGNAMQGSNDDVEVMRNPIDTIKGSRYDIGCSDRI